MESEKRKRRESVSLYIHFPFCLYKCHYCDFNSHALSAEKIPFERYFSALTIELEKHFILRGYELGTLYFGGGTPSLMPAPMLEKILGICRNIFKVTPQTEITLEANPKTLDREKLRLLWELGINRISLGVQSLHDDYLATFGRIHKASDARDVIRLVKEAGFASWNTDLIFGFPHQSLKEWQKDLAEMISFGPPHISCYAFTVEKEAPYSKMIEKGSPLPDDDLQADCFEVTQEMMAKAGYLQYETSNYCLPGHPSRHNLNYWNYGEYAGLGAGAVSFFRAPAGGDYFGYRTTNFKKPEEYMANPGRGPIEWIDQATAKGEFMMMGLRKKDGIDLAIFEECFGGVPLESYAPVIEKYHAKGWLNKFGTRLTEEGMIMSNQVVSSFLFGL